MGLEKLGQAALNSRGLEDSPRLWRRGHYTHFRLKSCKTLMGWVGGRGACSSCHQPCTTSRHPRGVWQKDYLFPNPTPTVPDREFRVLLQSQAPGLRSGVNQGGGSRVAVQRGLERLSLDF